MTPADIAAAVAGTRVRDRARVPRRPTRSPPAIADLPLLFPTADEFADDVDPRRNDRFRVGQFGGVDVLPFESVAWNLLAVHPRLIEVAEAVLGTDDLRLYRAEAWAKYSQAADYDQTLHRDFLNHSLVVPTDDPRYGQIEMFLYLTEMTADLGPTHVVPAELTAHLPPMPNHLEGPEHAHLLDAGELVLGPPGTLLVYRTDLFHRGTAVRRPRAARFTLHLNRPHRGGRVGEPGPVGRHRQPAGVDALRRALHATPARAVRVPAARARRTGPNAP